MYYVISTMTVLDRMVKPYTKKQDSVVISNKHTSAFHTLSQAMAYKKALEDTLIYKEESTILDVCSEICTRIDTPKGAVYINIQSIDVVYSIMSQLANTIEECKQEAEKGIIEARTMLNALADEMEVK